MALNRGSLLNVLRRMKAAGEDFFYDGESVAIRLIQLTPEMEEFVATSFQSLLSRHRDNAMLIGMLFVWEGYVSKSYDSERKLAYLVLTLEGWCPRTAGDFDREILSLHKNRDSFAGDSAR